MTEQRIAEHGVYLTLGSEVYNYKELNLDPERIYQVLRDKNFTKSIYEQLVNNSRVLKVKGIDEYIGEITDIVFRDCYIDSGFHVFSNDVFNAEIRNKLQIYPAIAYKAEAIAKEGFYEGVYYELIHTNPELDSVYMVEKAKRPIK